ncbi:DUF6712 family protein [Tenacibaculum maritimum]|uniref:DUF6712 family protein n=1 Tax=Tenacibaculum maritimum TaxID=107401 RepID=UPI0012E5359D|nr:DUF6712 family protein [Tenacibaculum maritimum]CAA0149883.1 conserved hypothetical protein [Tenacibaculum maritimum]
MIIKDTATLREHISVNGSVDIENLKPYLKKAERNFLKPLIGSEQLTVFELGQTDVIIKAAQALAQEAVANFGYYLYLPIGAVQISDNGIQVTANENTKQASDKQFKELQRSFKKSGHEALDELLDIMEKSADKFSAWFNSDTYTVYKELLVNKTSIFNKYYHIFNSRQTFVAMKPTIKVVEDQFISPVIGTNLLSALKMNQTNTIRKQVKELLQQSIVAFTIKKIVDNGMFVLDAKGIHMRFDVLPYEKTVTNINLRVNEFLTRTKKTKKMEGEEYLKLALNIINTNASTFAEHQIKESKKHIALTNMRSIVGI